MKSAKGKFPVKRNVRLNCRIYSGMGSKYGRNIQTVSQINKNVLLCDVTGKPSYDKMLGAHKEQLLHNELKPLLILLRLIGCLPIHFSKSDVPRFIAFSPAFIYSFCLYVLVNTSSVFVVMKSVLKLFKKSDSIGSSIFNSLLIIMLVNCSCIPVLQWIDTHKFVQYLQKWKQFQVMFAVVTGDNLILSARKRVICSIIFICAFTPIILFLHFFPPHLEYWQLLCYVHCLFVMNTNMSIFGCVLWSLFRAATHLNMCFKRDMNNKHIASGFLEKYRILWLRWSQLVSQMGCMLGKVLCLYLMLLLLVITVTLYAFLYGIKEKTDLWRECDLGLLFLLCAGTLYQFCDYAHRCTNNVAFEIRDELQLIAPSEFRHDISQEMKMFLETMFMYPPVVSVAGFVNVDRGLFRAFASTIVTYMIVLVQFDQSDRSHYICSGNVTTQTA